MYCYTHRSYYTGHCHHCCHCCHAAPAPTYWCSWCQRYTHTVHNHHWVQPTWPPPVVVTPVRPVIICGSQQRDRDTIHALAG